MILVAIGANLPGMDGAPPLETCRRATAALGHMPGLVLKGLSRWFESAPVPPSDQPPYINGVALLVAQPGCIVDPAELLVRLQVLEAECGRLRGAANAARTLDLDIVAIGGLIRSGPDPILPHPRAHERAFVLAPVADVAPDWMHPILKLSAAALLAQLPRQDIRVHRG